MKGGIEKLHEQASEVLGGVIAALEHDALGDSPIEKLFYCALSVHVHLAACTYENLYRALDENDLLTVKELADAKYSLIIQPQVQFPFGRVDFVIHAYDWLHHSGMPAWRRLIVECDGHDFHERTRQQAAKDRSRDREAQLAGFEVFRFTGSELWRDPWKCADQVVAWAQQGL